MWNEKMCGKKIKFDAKMFVIDISNALTNTHKHTRTRPRVPTIYVLNGFMYHLKDDYIVVCSNLQQTDSMIR